MLDFKSLKRAVSFLDIPNVYVTFFIDTRKNTGVHRAPLHVVNCVFTAFESKNWFLRVIGVPKFDSPILGRRKEKVIHNITVLTLLTSTWVNIDLCDHGFVALIFTISIGQFYFLFWVCWKFTFINFRILTRDEKSRRFCFGKADRMRINRLSFYFQFIVDVVMRL